MYFIRGAENSTRGGNIFSGGEEIFPFLPEIFPPGERKYFLPPVTV